MADRPRGRVHDRRSASRLSVALLVALLVAGLVAAIAVPPAAETRAADACEGGFELAFTQQRMNPEDVITLGQDRALLAGSVRGPGGKRSARLARWSRSGGWKTLLTRKRRSDAGFTALTRSGRDTWVVGYHQTRRDMAPLAMRKRPSGGWVERSPGSGGSRGAVLTDVASHRQGQAWAVGYRLDRPGTWRPYATRYSRGRWRTSNPRLRSGELGQLTSVSTARRGGTWIAGSTTRRRVVRPYIARRAGGGWKRMALPALGSGAITAISVPGRTRGYAVGYRYAKDGVRPLVLRWDGSAWSKLAPPTTTGTALLSDLFIGAGRDLSVVGSLYHAGSGKLRPFVSRRTADGWTEAALRSFPRDGLMTGADGDWVVGRDLANGLVARVCGRPAEVSGTRAPRPSGELPVDEDEPLPAPRTDLPPARDVEITSIGRNVRMRDVTREVGLPARAFTYGAIVRDFDGDGRDDIFLGGHASTARLYLDRGARYVRSARNFGGGDRHACDAADVDGSGLPDIYCTFGGSRGLGVTSNRLYLDPGGDGPMRTVPDAGGASEPLGRGRSVLFLDYDGDGRADLVVGQQPDRLDGLPSTNRVYRRTGAAAFSPVIDAGLPPSVGIHAMDSGDVDRDGRPDLLLVTNDPKAAGRASGIWLLRNAGDRFRPVRARYGIRSIGERDAELVRLDGDERPDLVQLSGARIRISLQRDGRFRKTWERAIRGGVALAAGDADGDGDTDLYVLRSRGSARTKDLLLFNRGDGRGFRVVQAPSRRGGRADDVVAIDHDQNGLTDFLALNGRGSKAGPVQLIAFYPR